MDCHWIVAGRSSAKMPRVADPRSQVRHLPLLTVEGGLVAVWVLPDPPSILWQRQAHRAARPSIARQIRPGLGCQIVDLLGGGELARPGPQVSFVIPEFIIVTTNHHISHIADWRRGRLSHGIEAESARIDAAHVELGVASPGGHLPIAWDLKSGPPQRSRTEASATIGKARSSRASSISWRVGRIAARRRSRRSPNWGRGFAHSAVRAALQVVRVCVFHFRGPAFRRPIAQRGRPRPSTIVAPCPTRPGSSGTRPCPDPVRRPNGSPAVRRATGARQSALLLSALCLWRGCPRPGLVGAACRPLPLQGPIATWTGLTFTRVSAAAALTR